MRRNGRERGAGSRRVESGTMSERTFGVLGLFDSADALMAAIPKVRARNLGKARSLHALSRPRHGRGAGPAALAPGWDGDGHGRSGCRHGALLPVVDERRGLPHHHGGQGPVLVAGLRAHHVRDHGPVRHLHGGPRDAAPPQQAALLRPPRPGIQGHPGDHAGPVRAGRGIGWSGARRSGSRGGSPGGGRHLHRGGGPA